MNGEPGASASRRPTFTTLLAPFIIDEKFTPLRFAGASLAVVKRPGTMLGATLSSRKRRHCYRRLFPAGRRDSSFRRLQP